MSAKSLNGRVTFPSTREICLCAYTPHSKAYQHCIVGILSFSNLPEQLVVWYGSRRPDRQREREREIHLI